VKIIIAPDKFKGSLTSFEVCNAITTGIKTVDNTVEVLQFPMADGGDGFSTVLQYYLHTQTITCNSVDPLGRNINASYQWDDTNKMAIIEMAAASGLVLLKKEERNPLHTSTFGTGLLIVDAINKGAQKILLGLGGSATTDAGTGILAALGFCFKDEAGNPLQANGANLLLIKKIISPVTIDLQDVVFEIACDVQNVLYGMQGASYIYARQKGADDQAIQLLDDGLKNISEVLKKTTGKDIAQLPGTGAAGGIAASLLCWFNVTLSKGIDIVIAASDIKSKIAGADLIITGEGKIDAQSLEGKVVSEIARLAHQQKIPVMAFCGVLEASSLEIKKLQLAAATPIVSASVSIEEAMLHAATHLTEKTKNFFLNTAF
jgi:glycerate 2-kinase